MNKLPNHTALKEWSNVVAALGRGEQVVLIRKGGIADPSFGVDAERFYLYPTYFHQGESESRPRVAITHWCEVVRTWTIRDAEQLARLETEVVLPRETLEMRYRFRADQALYVIGVRTFALPAPVEIAFRDAYAGCRSWISLDDEIDVTDSRAVLGERELASRIDALDAFLAVTASA
ncbi:MAG: DUF1802 family protein [Acidobacteria bacterium]|nr:DUF1802 family protein [Acidobacteriota bacterium]MBV9474698.1 DUF1802 family protein [Acidobacteriota bacterium]